MSRVSNKYHPPAQQNTDFHSFLPTIRPPTKSDTIKGHPNTCMKASRGNHNSLGWGKYLTMSRTWNFNYIPVFQLRNLVQLERFLSTVPESLVNPQGFVKFPMGHIQKSFRRFLGIFRLSIEHTRQNFCAVNRYSACDWLINWWSKPWAAIKITLRARDFGHQVDSFQNSKRLLNSGTAADSEVPSKKFCAPCRGRGCGPWRLQRCRGYNFWTSPSCRQVQQVVSGFFLTLPPLKFSKCCRFRGPRNFVQLGRGCGGAVVKKDPTCQQVQ
jgi:hypothetical protein